MSEQLLAELRAAARRVGLTDETVGRVMPLLRVAYEAGRKDGQESDPAPTVTDLKPVRGKK